MAKKMKDQELKAVAGGKATTTAAAPATPHNASVPLFYFDNQKHKYNPIKVEHGFMQIGTGALQPGVYQIGSDGRLFLMK